MIARLSRPVAALAGALLLAACSAAGEPTLTEAASTASASPSAAGPAATSSSDAEAVDAWRTTVADHRGANGEQFDYDCPAGGQPANVWGTDVYTDDSSVCTAAVHAGAITVEEGGTVVVEIRPGEEEYEASSRNGIDSLAYGPWGGSFVVVDE
jgi:LCCL domain